MNQEILNFEQDKLRIVVTKSGSTAHVEWFGMSDARNPAAFLAPVLNNLVETLKGQDVTVDFTKIEYMNSSTVSSIISLVKGLNGTAEKVVVLFADNDWQRIHLRCMRTITRSLKRVEVRGDGNTGG
jgi:hypothetical protein